MPPIKQAPPRYCAECGQVLTRKRYNGRLEDFGVFRRRMFCDTRCMAEAFDKRPSVAVSPTAHTGNYHARKMTPPGPCSRCTKANASDVHHINWNRNDNRPENLTRLCRGCHLRTHTWPARRLMGWPDGHTIAPSSRPRSTAVATTEASGPSRGSTS